MGNLMKGNKFLLNKIFLFKGIWERRQFDYMYLYICIYIYNFFLNGLRVKWTIPFSGFLYSRHETILAAYNISIKFTFQTHYPSPKLLLYDLIIVPTEMNCNYSITITIRSSQNQTKRITLNSNESTDIYSNHNVNNIITIFFWNERPKPCSWMS